MKKAIVVLSFLLCVTVVSAQSGKTTTFKTPQEAVNYYERLVDTLVQRVTALQDNNARLEAVVMDMQKRMNALTASNQELQQNVTELKAQFSADAESRKDQLDKIANKLTQATQTPGAGSGTVVTPPVSMATEFIEFTVPAGATLHAISKATGVSVSEIKKANKMTGDTLRAGQKLLIPKH